MRSTAPRRNAAQRPSASENYEYRRRVGRYFAPVGVIVYVYYLVVSWRLGTTWFLVVGLLALVQLVIDSILLFQAEKERVGTYLRRNFVWYARATILLISVSHIVLITYYGRVQYLPWTYIVPFLAIALLGVKEARWWSLAHGAGIIPRVFGLMPGTASGFDTDAGITATVVYLTIFLMSMLIETARQKSVQISVRQKENLRKSLQELEWARSEAEAANRSKSAFLANMSHELRTPLNHIIGFTELVADGRMGPVSPAQEEHLRDALGSSAHLLSLINDVLDLSKIEAGRVELEIAPCDPTAVISEAVRMVRDASEKNRELVQTGELDLPDQIFCDSRRLVQVLVNLLSNGVKFGADKPVTVLARTHSSTADGKSYSGAENVCMVRISVVDQGAGMEGDDLKRIFQRFERRDSSRTSAPGTGLGLAIARELVSLHRGQIWAESDGPGRGSTFSIELPVGTPDLVGQNPQR